MSRQKSKRSEKISTTDLRSQFIGKVLETYAPDGRGVDLSMSPKSSISKSCSPTNHLPKNSMTANKSLLGRITRTAESPAREGGNSNRIVFSSSVEKNNGSFIKQERPSSVSILQSNTRYGQK